MLVMKHSLAFFEFTRRKIYIRNIYCIVFLNVIKINIKYFILVDNSHITLISFI